MPATPASLGYHMPAEWAPHARCWMGFPCRAELWGGDAALATARRAYAATAQAINQFEPVSMICAPQDEVTAPQLCGSGIEIVPMPLNDSWLRDQGPTFLVDGSGKLAGVDWVFNCWGNLFPDYAEDAALAKRILAHTDTPRLAAPFVLEGGSFHVDGEGTVLTTAQCLLHPNRNPHLTRADIEQNLCDWLGVSKVLWLGNGLFDDHTDGHVDDIACFAKPGVVLAQRTDDPFDTNWPSWRDNAARLAEMTDAQGRKLEVITLPAPAARFDDAPKKLRLALSYINYYPANGGLVIPCFDDPADAEALAIFREVFPDRQIVQVPALDILRGGGGIHCITQQQPLGR